MSLFYIKRPLFSYQMYIRHEVAKHGCGYSKRPHAVRHHVKNTQVEVLPDASEDPAQPAPALSRGALLGLGLGRARTHTWGSHTASSRQQRFEKQSQQGLDEHEHAEDLEGPAQAQGRHHLLEEHEEADGEDAGARRHHTVGQAQTLAEVVAQDDQRGLKGEGGATAE